MPPVAILVEFRVGSGCFSEFEAKLRADATRTLQDDGCLRMEVLCPRTPDGSPWLSELWHDQAAIDAHRGASGHSHAWQEPLIEGKRVSICEVA